MNGVRISQLVSIQSVGSVSERRMLTFRLHTRLLIQKVEKKQLTRPAEPNELPNIQQ